MPGVFSALGGGFYSPSSFRQLFFIPQRFVRRHGQESLLLRGGEVYFAASASSTLFSAFVPMCGAKSRTCRGRCGERDVGSGAGLYVRVPALGHRGCMLPSAASFVKELRENSSLLGSPDGDEIERSQGSARCPFSELHEEIRPTAFPHVKDLFRPWSDSLAMQVTCVKPLR